MGSVKQPSRTPSEHALNALHLAAGNTQLQLRQAPGRERTKQTSHRTHLNTPSMRCTSSPVSSSCLSVLITGRPAPTVPCSTEGRGSSTSWHWGMLHGCARAAAAAGISSHRQAGLTWKNWPRTCSAPCPAAADPPPHNLLAPCSCQRIRKGTVPRTCSAPCPAAAAA